MREGSVVGDDWMTVAQHIERDVRRTDRSNQYYKRDKDGNRHVATLKSVSQSVCVCV